jgi:hypothetical protein
MKLRHWACALLSAPAICLAQGSVYKCVETSGRVTLQQTPCAAASFKGGKAQTQRAVRNASGDPEMVTTLRRCESVTMDSPNFGKCRASLMCVDQGYVGAELRLCLREAESQLNEAQAQAKAAEQKALVRKMLEETSVAEESLPNHPRAMFPVGKVFDNQVLLNMVDERYPGTEFRRDQTQVIPFNGAYYTVATEKVNNTDIPARYRILSVTRSVEKPSPLANMARSLEQDRRAAPVVDCVELSMYAKARGMGFFERAQIVDSAKRSGLCL